MATPVNPFTVRACGEIDLDTGPRLHREVERALARHRQVVLDLSEVTFMDCAGLNAVIRARELAERRGRRLVLRGIGHPVARLLKLTGVSLTP
ncbi:STAS domain-containing protein [Kitasatospora sp. NPDC092039]|uniref:STAS domain-containing protein n=1 Tax=Kitasatospora sp. NPDC092039 TaxID=3364086 RepID=UPI003824D9DF